MALAPQFATHRIAGTPESAHTLEVFLDLTCHYSKKQLTGIREHLLPLVDGGPLAQHLTVIIRQVLQPWWPTSTLVHEAALGVSKTLVESGKSYDDTEVRAMWKEFFFKLMDDQEAYFNDVCADETPNQTRERLADHAASVGLDRAAFLKTITVGKGNSGTSVSPDLKLQIRYHRTRGVHVTPTVFLDGLLEPSISSSFTGDDWKKFVNDKILPTGAAKL